MVRFRGPESWGADPNSRYQSVIHAQTIGGQSNAEGQASAATAQHFQNERLVPFFHWAFDSSVNSTQLEELRTVNNKHGIEFSLANGLRAGSPIAIYRHSRHSSRISLWQPGQVAWDEWAARIPRVEGMLQQRGFQYVNWTVHWLQGEADAADDPADPTAHIAALRALIARLRDSSLCGPGTRVIIYQLHPGFVTFGGLPAQGFATINSALETVAGDEGNTLVTSTGVPNPPDIHYSSAGYNILGMRGAEATLPF